MSKHGTAPVIQVDQFAEFAAYVVRSLPRDIDPTIAQGWIGNTQALSKVLREALMPSQMVETPDVSVLLADWQNFYREEFGIEVDFSNLQIPEKRAGFDRLIVVAQGITAQRVYDKCSELFGTWKYTDRNLDEAVPTNDRTAEAGAYAIWVRDRVEADQELKNMSANTLKKKGTSGITLTERLLYELKYYKETGKHLDIENLTLCSGSRRGGGSVPRVYWHSDYSWLRVRWADPDCAYDYLCSREVSI